MFGFGSARKYDEILSDSLLLMRVISKTKKGDLGITKLAKLIYLIECKLAKDNVKTFNYHFSRDFYGPFTLEIYNDLEALEENGLVSSATIKLTKRGRKILKQCSELFESNTDIVSKIDEIIEKYDKLSLIEIKSLIYDSEASLESGLSQKVGKVPLGTDLKVNVLEKDAKDKFAVSQWDETLDIYFNDEACASLNEAMRDAKEGRFCALNEEF